jgi:hypothetical protein
VHPPTIPIGLGLFFLFCYIHYTDYTLCFQDTVCTYYKHGSMSPFYWSFFAFSNVLWCLWFNLVQQFLPTYGLKTWMIVGQWSDSLMRPILTRDVQVGMEGAPVKSPVFGHFLVWSQWSTAGFHQGSDSRHPTNPRTFPSLSSIIRAFVFRIPFKQNNNTWSTPPPETIGFSVWAQASAGIGILGVPAVEQNLEKPASVGPEMVQQPS